MCSTQNEAGEVVGYQILQDLVGLSKVNGFIFAKTLEGGSRAEKWHDPNYALASIRRVIISVYEYLERSEIDSLAMRASEEQS